MNIRGKTARSSFIVMGLVLLAWSSFSMNVSYGQDDGPPTPTGSDQEITSPGANGAGANGGGANGGDANGGANGGDANGGEGGANGGALTKSIAAERTAVSLRKLTDAWKAVDVAKKAIDEQAKSGMDLLEKTRKANEAEATHANDLAAAKKAKADESAAAAAAELKAQESRKAADEAEDARIFAAEDAAKKASAAKEAAAAAAAALRRAQETVEDNASGESPSDEERAAYTARVAAAVEAVALAKAASEEQLKSENELLEKTREAIEAAANANRAKADMANREESAESEALDDKAEVSNRELAEAEDARIAAAEDAAKKASAAKEAVAAAEKALEAARQSLSPEKAIFHWRLFLLLAVLFSSVFALSAYAFRVWALPGLKEQLEIDYQMLGRRATKSPKRTYFIHVVLAMFVAILGAALFCWRPGSLFALDIYTQRGMQLGFLGAYVYALSLVYRRYTTRDLQPHVYLSCAVGMIAGIVFNYVAFTAIASVAGFPPEFEGVGAGAAAILAFSLGYFPTLAVRWFGRISRSSVHERQRRSDALPLSLIDGISELHESRLKDEGIDNVQNLAAADIYDLVGKAPYSAQQIVAWVDQALLYLYLDPSEIDSFRRAGVRSVTDFHDMWAKCALTKELRDILNQPSARPGNNVPANKDSADVGAGADEGAGERAGAGEGGGDPAKAKPPRESGNGPVNTESATASAEVQETRKSIALQLVTTEQRLDCLYRATEKGPNMEHVRTYWHNVQTEQSRARDLFINQICGGVGRALRENVREGTPSADSILTQVAEKLLAAAAPSAKVGVVKVTPASLYGRAYLNSKLGETNEARRLLVECIEQFPNHPVAYNDLAWLDLQTRSRTSDLRAARNHAERAIKLIEAEIEKATKAADQAGIAKDEATKKMKKSQAANKTEEADQYMLQAHKAAAEQAVKKAEAKDLTSDMASYRDTLALAEIRLGNLENGEEESEKAIGEWADSGRAPDGRFLETLVSAAEAYLSKAKEPSAEDKAKAKGILANVDEKGFASEPTVKKIAQLREDHGLNPS